MCGILAIIGALTNGDRDEHNLRALIVDMAKEIRHRGPDWSGVYVSHFENYTSILAHERLAIVDPVGGAQPLTSSNQKIALSTNAEIYNHEKLKQELAETHPFKLKTGSDCEIIVHMFESGKSGVDLARSLDGPHAYVMINSETGIVLAGRDHMGIMPMYWGYRRKDNAVVFCSEMKGLHTLCDEFWIFEPGSITQFKVGSGPDGVRAGMKRYYNPIWWDLSFLPSNPADLSKIRNTLEMAVNKRLMADVPFGVLLSGGLDSSLIASLAVREMDKRIKQGIQHKNAFIALEKLHSFTIGMAHPETGEVTSPDILCAREVAKFIGTVHHEFNYTIQEGIDAIPHVIKSLETYDITTIRAGIPMYLLARRIKAMGIKMILSGEGADEVFGGYLYFHKAPNPSEFHQETVRKVQGLHYYDVQRANKAMAAAGVEVRVPFLDKQFLDVAMMLDPKEKMINESTQNIEKYVLRKAFDDSKNPFLPESVLWRQKEQFSDGVGYQWIDLLKEHANSMISDSDMTGVEAEFAYNTPRSKEGLYYRRIFNSVFPGKHAALTLPANIASTVACSTPKAIEWDEAFKQSQDPSGLSVIDVHAKRRKLNNGN
eukprot:c20035_g1_i3.p1 GENE.c20035_g1_i3~~c20035_g1_i3.p1  ORF type:complete len:600 (+),score=274.84 c20035_g1_i3:42-1841(+)